jgi:hypothetical protein
MTQQQQQQGCVQLTSNIPKTQTAALQNISISAQKMSLTKTRTPSIHTEICNNNNNGQQTTEQMEAIKSDSVWFA